MTIELEPHLRSIASPANLLINDRIVAFRERCRQMGCERPYHHFAFGESPFPPPPAVTEALADSVNHHGYVPTAGVPALRAAVANYYDHHFGLDVTSDQVVVSPGSKEMISMLLAVVAGPVIVPRPAWVSYLPQAEILRKKIVSLELKASDDYRLTPEGLRDVAAPLAGQKLLLLNQPHNPTGATYSLGQLEELAEVCRETSTIVLADEIYARTAFDESQFASMARVYPEGTVATGGLSKDRSAGGYRLGVGVFPPGDPTLVGELLKIAGSTYSCVAAPIQHAGVVAYALGDEVEDWVELSRAVNAVVGREAAARARTLPGAEVSTPGGGFYFTLDLNAHRSEFAVFGIEDSAALAEDLLAVEHVAVLPGTALLLPPGDLRFRVSYVDYDGEAALRAWRDAPPQSRAEKRAFFERHCPLVVEGINYIGRYLDQVRTGSRPAHVAAAA